MAVLNSIDIYMEFEPIVKLVCEAIDCQYNLVNAANIPERREAACNLKQITIGRSGACQNFKPVDRK